MSTGFLPFFTIAATPSSRCHSLLRCCSRVIDMSASQSSSVTSSFPSNRTSTWRNNSFVVLQNSGSNVERPSMGRPRWQSRRQCQVASAAAIPQGIAIGEEEEWLHLPTMVGVRGAVQGAHRPPRPPPPLRPPRLLPLCTVEVVSPTADLDLGGACRPPHLVPLHTRGCPPHLR